MTASCELLSIHPHRQSPNSSCAALPHTRLSSYATPAETSIGSVRVSRGIVIGIPKYFNIMEGSQPDPLRALEVW